DHAGDRTDSLRGHSSPSRRQDRDRRGPARCRADGQAARARDDDMPGAEAMITTLVDAGFDSHPSPPKVHFALYGIWSHLDQLGRPSSKLKRASIATPRTSISC